MTENEEVEQLQPLVENGRPPPHRPNNVVITSANGELQNNNVLAITSDVEHRISSNDIVISVRNAHKCYGKVRMFYYCYCSLIQIVNTTEYTCLNHSIWIKIDVLHNK
jgi:hypothetical protein